MGLTTTNPPPPTTTPKAAPTTAPKADPISGSAPVNATGPPKPTRDAIVVLNPGGKIKVGANERVKSLNGLIALSLQKDQTLLVSCESSQPPTLYKSDNPPAKSEDPQATLILLANGQLEIVSGAGQIVWSVNEGRKEANDTVLMLHDNGHLVIYQNGTPTWRSTCWKVPFGEQSRLGADEFLQVDRYLTSPDTMTKAKLNQAGNLIVLDKSNKTIYQSKTVGTDSKDPNKKLWMRDDDNLVITGTGWTSGTRLRKDLGSGYMLVENGGYVSVWSSNGIRVWCSNASQVNPSPPPQMITQVAKGSSRLRRGEYLPAGQQLVSPNGAYACEILNNAYLALRRRTQAGAYELIWISDFVPKASKVLLQWNGDLVLSSETERPTWKSGTEQAYKDPVLVLSDDGSLSLDNTDIPWRTRNIFPASVGKPDRLMENDCLLAGQALVSKGGECSLTLQDNVSLCVQSKGGDKTYYYLKVGLSGAAFLRFIRNYASWWVLEAYDKAGATLWSSDDFKERQVDADPTASFTIFDNGAAWIRTTTGSWSTYWLPHGPSPQASSRLLSNKAFVPGDVLVSPNGLHYLTLRDNGSLALWWIRSSEPGEPRWQSMEKGAGKGRFSAILQSDGVLSISDADKSKLVAKLGVSTAGIKDPYLELQDSGCFVIKSGAKEIWNSNTTYWDDETDPFVNVTKKGATA